MRTVLRKRFYCDHCKKGGCSSFHMRVHERGCTLNPNRSCGVCSKIECEPQPLAHLIAFVISKSVWEGDPSLQGNRGFLPDDAVKQLREFAAGCPVCMLAALRQAKCIASREVFDMKAELASIWADARAA